MADKELEELKKLSPEERIERLRKIAEKNKKEIEEAQKLIKKSQEELEEKRKQLEKIPIPQLKAISIEELFSEDEKQIFETKRFIRRRQRRNLEHSVNEQARREEQRQYQIKLSQEPLQKLYEIAQNIYREVRQTGELNEEQRQQITNINYALQRKEQDINNGKYKASSEEIQGLMSVTKSIMKYIRG